MRARIRPAARLRRPRGALNEANNPFLLSGVKVQPSAKTARLALARFAKGRWMLFGGLIAART
jgi:hypothetical protein